jgi:hypothetical protein
VGTINDIDCDSERKEDRSMAEFKARFCKVKAHERSVFSKFKSSETGWVGIVIAYEIMFIVLD